MAHNDNRVRLIEEELQRFPPVVTSEYQKVRPHVESELSEEDFSCWAQWGKLLAEDSPELASAYFRASGLALRSLSLYQLEDWMKLGKSLYNGTRRSVLIASQFYQVGANLFPYLTWDEMAQFVSLINRLQGNADEIASQCLSLAEQVFSLLEKQDRTHFLNLALVFAKTDWNVAKSYFVSGPKVLSRIERDERARFLSLAEGVFCRASERAIPFLFDGSQSLGELPESTHHSLLSLTDELTSISCPAAIEFLKLCPTVVNRIGLSGLESWFREGIKTLQKNEESGIAYFRLELNSSLRLLQSLSRGVELTTVKETLSRYFTALTGRTVHLLPAGDGVEKGLSKLPAKEPGVEEIAVFLPGLAEKYLTKEENFAWYKVMVTHQAGHLEFGSFCLSLAKKDRLFRDLCPQLTQGVVTPGGAVSIESFLNLFGNRRLATDIFTLVEDTRVDYLLKREYQGIRSYYARIQKDALSERQPLTAQPLKQMFLEVLLRVSLESSEQFSVPSILRTQLYRASQILGQVRSPQAKVEDSAQATIRLYQILYQIPDRQVPLDDWATIDLNNSLDGLVAPSSDSLHDTPIALPDVGADSTPYNGLQEVEYRGNFLPTSLPVSARPNTDDRRDSGRPSAVPLWLQLENPPEDEGDVEINELSTAGMTASQGLFVSNLKETGRQKPGLIPPKNKDNDDNGAKPLQNDDSRSFLYDEWDFRASDYRLRWCRVKQKAMGEGNTDFFEVTLDDYASLVARIKKQFEQLDPRSFKKIKKLQDGEDFDLDAVIDSVVGRKAGQGPDEKVYWRRNKRERDISVVFLLDMSSSTMEYIDNGQREAMGMHFFRDDKGYLEWLQSTQGNQLRSPAFKRIIDLEKESTVLLIKALETTGDKYAIYGFSGCGRENVEFYVIKDLGEDFSDRIKRRIDSIAPQRSTRMGPAIRHATWKLEQEQARSKFLFVISDGRPEDHGYGKDGLEREYAINDTRMALLEANWKGVTPFCLTFDRDGHDYLKTMCADMRYEVIDNIESLPERLPSLYRKLTI